MPSYAIPTPTRRFEFDWSHADEDAPTAVLVENDSATDRSPARVTSIIVTVLPDGTVDIDVKGWPLSASGTLDRRATYSKLCWTSSLPTVLLDACVAFAKTEAAA